ncbi:MAG: hypothetical protein JO053_00475 [Acidobacteria bacterium]|nr:hypothetical protein [Acidobacteriota bacterium]
MNIGRNLSILVLSIILTVPLLAQSTSSSQSLNFALQRGYRTGYSDGYMAGYRDTIDSLSKSYQRHTEYGKADRTYSKEYGAIEDFRDGYQQGFETGYDTGFERRSFDANLPTTLSRRGVIVGDRQNMADNTATTTQQTSGTADPARTDAASSSSTSESATATEPAQTYAANSGAIIQIPRDTELLLELQDDLSTSRSRAGDKFTAKIISPSELAGATVEGRVAKVTLPGRLRRRSELSLTFDRILLNDNRWSNFSATLVEVMPVKGDNIKVVDNEGTAIGQTSYKTDAIKVGASTGAGAIAGGVIGGPVGVAVGAGMGAAFGVGAVVIDRGKHINLARSQQLRVKTSYETNIR